MSALNHEAAAAAAAPAAHLAFTSLAYCQLDDVSSSSSSLCDGRQVTTTALDIQIEQLMARSWRVMRRQPEERERKVCASFCRPLALFSKRTHSFRAYRGDFETGCVRLCVCLCRQAKQADNTTI